MIELKCLQEILKNIRKSHIFIGWMEDVIYKNVILKMQWKRFESANILDKENQLFIYYIGIVSDKLEQK